MVVDTKRVVENRRRTYRVYVLCLCGLYLLVKIPMLFMKFLLSNFQVQCVQTKS